MDFLVCCLLTLVAKQTMLLVSLMAYSPTVLASSSTLPSKMSFWFSTR